MLSTACLYKFVGQRVMILVVVFASTLSFEFAVNLNSIQASSGIQLHKVPPVFLQQCSQLLCIR